jgi:hypothetical protein
MRSHAAGPECLPGPTCGWFILSAARYRFELRGPSRFFGFSVQNSAKERTGSDRSVGRMRPGPFGGRFSLPSNRRTRYWGAIFMVARRDQEIAEKRWRGSFPIEAAVSPNRTASLTVGPVNFRDLTSSAAALSSHRWHKPPPGPRGLTSPSFPSGARGGGLRDLPRTGDVSCRRWCSMIH